MKQNLKYKILVVDDEPHIVENISQILVNQNYEVLAAFQGDIAYEIALSTIPDIIIMDWEMPIMNGIEALYKIKSEPTLSQIPVIMITGRMTSIEHFNEAISAGAIDFINKPVDQIELVARIRSMLILADFFKQTLKQKDWELTLLTKDIQHNMHLIERVMSHLETILSKMKKVCEKEYNDLHDLISDVSSDIKSQTWEDFNVQFKKVHPDFSSNLLASFPKLSSEEVKLCHLLRLNLNTKEIAGLTFKNAHSVDIARYRIRKKLNLDRNDNLNSFLSRF